MSSMFVRRRLTPLTVAGAALLVLAACGSDDPTGTASDSSESAASDLTGTLDGAGASAQEAAMQAWIAGFQTANPDVTVNYNPVGSGGGRTQFLEGGVAFAGSDSAMDEEEVTQSKERCGEDGAIHLPNYISPIAVAFNLEGIETLNMTPDTIASIFAQTITNWNDPAIAADNPDATLPDLAITPVNRSDESGTTENFTEYLAAAAPSVWTSPPDGVWPVTGGEAAQGTSGVVSAIQAANGAIGYADASQIGELGKVNVGVGSEFVELSPEAAAAVVETSPRADTTNGENDIVIALARDTTESGNYPIVLVSYHIACLNYEDAEQGELVKAFLTYASSDEGQTASSEATGSAPTSGQLRTDIEAAVEQIQAG